MPVALAMYQRAPGRTGYARAPVAAVVKIARVAVAGVPGVTFTELLGLKLNVGRFWAPAGLEVIAAVSVTLPLKPPIDVTVIVEVFPVVAPGLTEMDMGAPATVKQAACVTVTEASPLAGL